MVKTAQNTSNEMMALLEEALGYQENGKNDLADKAFKKALKKYGDVHDVVHLAAMFYAHIGRHRYAINLISKIIKEKAGDYRIQRLLGQAYFELDEYETADNHLQTAKSLNPDDPQTLRYYGLTSHKLGRFDLAEQSYARSLMLEHHISTYNNLAEILILKQRQEDAIKLLEHALEHECFDANTLVYLAVAYKEGHIKAIEYLIKAYSLDPQNEAVKPLIALNCFAGASPKQKDDLLRGLMHDCLQTNTVSAMHMRFVWQMQIFENTTTEALETQLKLTNYENFDFQQYKQFLYDDLFIAGICKIFAYDRPLEKLLTFIRRHYLNAIVGDNLKLADKDLSLLSAMTAQCDLNEYVFFVTEEEQQQIDKIKQTIETTDSLDKLEQEILIYSCYEPLTSLNNASKISKKLYNNPLFEKITHKQITQYKEQQNLKKTIKSFGRITDSVSKKVQEQYEENPYPRWNGANYLKPLLLKTIAPQYLPRGKLLIAGCGTGRHIAHTNSLYFNFDILAVDLSKSSLAYAMMKTKEFDFKNVKFLHADILDLKDLGQEFDMIESVGVIHHMENPEAGLQSLVSCLKPGGTLKLGLYSEIARTAVVEAIEIIKNQGFEPTIDGIRACREYIYEQASSEDLSLVKYGLDTFTTSTCRDFIFNVQETRYTLPEIQKLLENNGLKFDKFIMPNPTLERFKKKFPEQGAITDLEKWHQFEQENPRTFEGMYQFLCSKA